MATPILLCPELLFSPAVLGLRCCVSVFCSCGEQRLLSLQYSALSSCSTWAQQLCCTQQCLGNIQKNWVCQLSSVQSLSRLRLFATRWTTAHRPPCPSPTPRVHPNPCPLDQWCHPTISSSVVPSPPALNLSQHRGLFQWVSSSHQVAKILELQLHHQSFQWIFRADLL